MANDKLILAQTDLNILVGNLRGEIGEIITAWLLMRHFIGGAARLRSDDVEKDFSDKNINFAELMADKLGDELVARLSELADKKIGRLNFYFVARKLDKFTEDVAAFERHILKTEIRAKRNRDISHKALPGLKPEKRIHIDYRTMLRTVAIALRFMKRIDRHVLGPSAPFLWKEARKRRYSFLTPPSAAYMLVPYLNLTPDERTQIVLLELAEGKQTLSPITASIDGKQATILASMQWGVLVLGGQMLALARYPLADMGSVSIDLGS